MSAGGITDRYRPIESYGLIGNCLSGALVNTDGSIDWCCFPRFDSPSVFARLLDARRGGGFAIRPAERYTSRQSYVPDANVLETTFSTDSGDCTITDCMPVYQDGSGRLVQLHQIVRVVRGIAGKVTVAIKYGPRPEYGRSGADLKAAEHGVVASAGGSTMELESPVPLDISGGSARARATLEAGQDLVFVVTYGDQSAPRPLGPAGARERVQRTIRFWRDKAADLKYAGEWREEVLRSYLALHLLTYSPTGAIVAAPTTSLPEAVGGIRNWDYRYTWLRDAAFTVDALVSLGHEDEALSFFKWLHLVCARFGEDLQIMYRVDSESELVERELDHLEGYKGSKPVRVGNGAYRQLQHDIYGEVLSSAYLLAQSGQRFDEEQWDLLKTLANLAEAHWQEPDSGIWEVRGGPYHFVYSKVMCWVALDRAVKLAEMHGRSGGEVKSWKRTADAIKAEVVTKGWSARNQAFVQHYDNEAMDASNLLIPIVGFLPFDDPRVVSTVQRIREDLGEGPFVRRYLTSQTDDGLTGEEGVFTLCGFWLVQVMARMGRTEEARERLNTLLRYGNHVGLFSEMVDPLSGAALGNFPQAFTHIGLILAARECGVGQDC